MIYQGKLRLFTTKNHPNIINQSQDNLRSFSINLAHYLSITGLGQILITINAALSFIYVVLSAVTTYQVDLDVLSYLSLTLILIFIVDWIINLIITDNTLIYLFGSNSLMEYTSIIPNFLVLTKILDYGLYIMPLSSTRIILCFKFMKVLSRRTQNSTRYVFSLIMTFVSLMIISSSILLWAEVDQGLQYHQYLYFMIVTLSTVGYGEISPKSIYGKFVIIGSICILFMVIPTQTQDIVRFNKLKSQFARDKFTKKLKQNKYILMLGNSNVQAFQTFLTELYHPDHGQSQLQTLIMLPHSPKQEMNYLLNNFKNVTFLQGNPLDQNDLIRCRPQESSCVVILANKMSANELQQDYRNIMYSYAVKLHVNKVANKLIRVCLQLHNPQNKPLFYTTLKPQLLANDQPICLEQLKLNLLGKTCICPGINTLISMLITSTGDINQSQQSSDWLKQYEQGCSNEIYRFQIDQKYRNRAFGSITKDIFKQHGLLLIALQINILGQGKVFLNPSEYVLTDQVYYGYLIASSINQLSHLFKQGKHSSMKKKLSKVEKKQKQLLRSSETNEGYYLNRQKHNYINIDKSIFTKFRGHILVCGISMKLKFLLMPLRVKSLTAQQIIPLLILHNQQMPTELWKQIRNFPHVYFLRGSPLKIQDLKSACIENAQSVVILPQFNIYNEFSQSSMMDADTIFIYKTVKLLNPNAKVFTQLSSVSTISFLSSLNNNTRKHFQNQIFASGQIFISTMLDTLICHAFYYPFITFLLEQLLLGNANVTKEQQKYYKNLKLQQSNLFLYQNRLFTYQKFGQVFYRLIQKKMLAIGIYRYQNTRNYVFLRPNFDTLINQNDQIYVLCEKEPMQQKTAYYHDRKVLQQDLQNKRQIEKIQQSIKFAQKEIKSINRLNFQKDFISHNFIKNIKQFIEQELKNKTLK